MAFAFRNACATICLVICGATPSVVMGQCNDPFPPSLTCNGAQVVCDLDGYCSTSGALNAQDDPSTFCGNVENNQWIAFVAGSANLELLLFITNCSNNNGLQAQIFETSDCVNYTPVSNCFNPAFVTNGTLTANGLTLGQTYYLMIDGWAAAVCDYTIIVMNGSTGVSPDAIATGPIELCPGQTALLDGSGSASGANINYQWTTTDGNIVSGDMTLTPTIDAPGTYVLSVTNTLYNCAQEDTLTVNPATPPTVMAAVNDSLSCNMPTLQLDGSGSSTGGMISYGWTTSDGNITMGGNTLTPTIDQAGTYTLTVTNNSTGCTAEASVSVTANFAIPDVNASGGTLTCAATTTSLNGSSTTPGVSFSWTGPGGFTSNLPNPDVTQTGNYVLTVTAPNGCTAAATAMVNEDITLPNSSATGGTIDCNNNTVQLMGNSTTSGVTYSWTGPNNYSSAEQNPTVSTAGTYTLVVMAANGCTSDEMVTVAEDLQQPNAMATGGAIDCTMTSIQLAGSSSTPGVTYSWAGPNNFNSNLQNPTVSTAGTYTLTVTAPNGCTNSAMADVMDNGTIPDVSATGGTIDCTNSTVQLMGNSTTPNVSYGWTGPNNFSSTEQNPTVSTGGTYTLTVIAPNGCSNSTTADVVADLALPNVTATGGTIDCSNSSIQLMGNSSTAGVSYAWTGPAGFSSMEQNPTVSTAGTYTLTVTASNGCSDSATANVIDDTALPNISAAGGTIDCNNNSVQLMGNSTTSGVTYSWTGPNTFTSTEQNPTVSTAGTYTLVVMGSNACTNSATANVIDDTALPNISATGGTIDCNNNSVQLMGNSTTPNVSYSWTGPNNFASTEQNPTVSTAGTYTLVVMGSNGCTNSATADVVDNSTLPNITATGGTIDCNNSSVQLMGNSTTSGVTYSWTGPNNFSSTEQNPIVNEAGTYTLVVSNANGCTNSTTVDVIDDTTIPNITATGGTIDCNNNSVQLMGNSTTSGVTYSWTGPNNFSSTEQNPTVNGIGTYILVVSSSNGCTNSATADVINDTTVPNASAVGGTIDCNNNMVQLMGNSTTSGVTYNWTGPNSFSSTEQNPTVSNSGTYTLVVTASNGCTNSITADVIDDTTVPNVSATGGTIDCNNNTVQLMGNSTTSGVTYSWTGPNNFNSSEQNPIVNEAGTYTLVVTASNGCTNSTIADVTDNSTLPNISAVGGTIDCNNNSVQLMGNSTTSGVTYNWTGLNSFTSTDQNPIVSIAGTYTLVVTTSNDCTNSATADVIEDTAIPNASATGGTIGCNNNTVQLMGNSTTSGVTYSWTGPGGFTSIEQNPTVNESGTYTLTITTSNGCTATSDAIVTQDATVPNAQATGGDFTCTINSVQLMGNSTTSGITYSWTGPNNFTSTEQNPTVTVAGMYQLTVTAPNGCFAIANAEVIPFTVPNASATGGTIDCNNNAVQLMGNSTTSGITYSWTGPNSFTSTEQNPTVSDIGTYTLTVTDTNGCTNTATADVLEDSNLPDVTATGGTIDCNNNAVQLMGSSTTSGVTYSWTGPNSFTSAEQNPTVSDIGTYTLVVTASNGCTNSATADVLENNNLPDVTAIGGTIDCNNNSVQLLGSSTTNGVSYSWTGPGGFASTEQNPTVTDAGTYTLMVTAPNGCSNMATAQVNADFANPNASAIGGTISCTNSMVQLMGNSTTANVTYSWTGPDNFTSTEQNPTVTDAGTYILEVTAPNGCTTTATALVNENGNLPTATATDGIINCNNTSITLMGDSQTAGVTYSWTGPNNFTSTQQNPIISIAGNYVLEVTAPNGCTAQATAIVTEDLATPDISATGNTITCATSNVQIFGDSNTPNVSFGWTGPGGFTSSEQNPIVNQIGNYQLTVTGANGCVSSMSVEVLADAGIPDATATGGEITCLNASVIINGASNTAGVQFNWSGPNNFTSTDPNPTVAVAGNYTLTVTAPNGCTAQATAPVIDNSFPPDVSAIGDTLTCNNNQVMLEGNSNMPNVTYAWTGPNNFMSNEQNPIVSQAGIYELMITGDNGCTNTATALVDVDENTPNVSAIGGTIDCQNGTIILQGNSNTPNVTYAWTGPNNFMSDEQNPTTNMEGTYTLMVTAENGCSTTTMAVVSMNGQLPEVTATGGLLTCAEDSIQVFANANLSGTTFTWTGPDNFTSSEQNPHITTAGTYFLVGTAPNGCIGNDTLLVESDTDVPVVSAVGGVLNCNNPTIQIQSNSNNTGLTFVWSGPNNFTSDEQNPTVTETGTYEVLATLPSGCSATTTTTVTDDFSTPVFQTIGGTITCTNDTLTIGVDFANGVYEWTGPNGFSSVEQNPEIMEAGDYFVTVTGANGCFETESLTVSENTVSPNVSAVGGAIDCDNSETQLNANSTTPNVNYQWTGPGSFSSQIPNPLVNQVGNYEVVVTSDNGCTASAAVMVVNDGDLPDVEAIGGTQTCNDLMVQLMGNSTTSGVTYAWTGPNGFSSNLQNPLVDEAGDYTLTVSTPSGCSATSNAVINPPVEPQAEIIGNELSCLNDSVTIFGVIDISVIDFVWTGPNNFTSNEQNPTITTAGNYELMVTAANGCTGSSTILIEEDISTPQAVATGDTLTCSSNSAQLMGSSTTAGVTYEWTGQNGAFQSDQQNPMVTAAGIYALTVTAPNGCSTTTTTSIEVDETIPTVSLSGGALDCLSPNIQIESTVSEPNLTFTWTGPNNFSSDEPNPLVAESGTYNLIVTAINGCTASASTLIEAASIPDVVAIGGTIGCNGNTTLAGNSTADNPQFQWVGPNSFNSTNPNPVVNEGGNYTLTVTAENGCTNEQTVMVTLDNTPPDISASAGVITCETPAILLNGQSNTPQVNYFWTNNNGFSSSLPNPEVSESGTYELTVTAPNDCTATLTVEVLEDTAVPDAIAEGGELTCIVTSVQLMGSSTTPNVSYSWSDNGSFLSTLANPIVQQAGEYTLTISAPNGCTSVSTAQVISNTTPPTSEAGETQHIDCDNREITLSGDLTAPSGNSSTQWFTFNGSISGNPESKNTQVDRGGLYFFEVVDEQNGCFALDSVLITQDPDMILFADFSTIPTCPGTESGSIILDNVIGGVSPFLMSVAGSPFEQTNQVDGLFFGQFLVQIEDAVGCQYDTYINVAEAEGIQVDLGDDIFLQFGDSVQLNPQINTPPDNITDIQWVSPNFLDCTDCLRPWATPPATTSYELTLTNDEGCTATDEILIQVSERFPVYAPNAFSPNGDEKNDAFTIFGGEQILEIKTMRIFDRWGALMFEQNNFQPNEPSLGWNGTFNGQLMNSGVYIYFAEVVFKEGTSKVFKGDITLVR